MKSSWARIWKIMLIVGFGCFLLIFLWPQLPINLWLWSIERAYVIPEESSFFTFNPTVLNPGSGEWWIYGEDQRFFYYFSGDERMLYISYPKKLAMTCSGFDPKEV
jgi:hypothetical protein